jgi:CubicO group peptidase (beta-lactamase class C family)
MMHKMRLLFALVVFTSGFVSVMAQDNAAIYEDPAGLFSVPIPTNWTAEAGEGFVTLTDPDEEILTYALVVPGEDITEAVDEAWGMVAPEFEFNPVQNQEVPSPPGVEQTVVLTELNDDQTHLWQGFGQLVDGNVYVLLFDADIVAAQQRNSQIQVIASGFTIHALTRTDLTGVEPLALKDDLIAQLEAYINETLATLEVPGASVAVAQDGEIVYAEGFGVRKMGGDDPVTAETQMMIGSTTKSMTTMMMATLVDDGLMEWDQPVVDILPTFAVADEELSQTITVRNLVCACTGVPRRDLEWVFNTLTPEEVIESLSTFRFFTDFGEAFQYSNQMVATGGYMAAEAAGGSGDLYQDYLDAMQARVFDPIGMNDTTFSFEDVEANADHATPHGANLLGAYQPIPFSDEAVLIPIGPAGAVWSNAQDMARYVITELNEGVSPDGERVVSAENLAETWQPQVAISANVSYGLGWIIDEYKSLPMIQHGGNTFGFTSDLAFLPDVDLGIVVLTNARGSNLFNEAVRFRLLELLFEQEAEYQKTIDFALETSADAVEEAEDQLQDEIDVEAVTPYLGTYTSDTLGEITLSLEDGKLMLDAGEFTSELREALTEDGETVYMTYDPPVAGLPFELVGDADAPGVVIDIVTDQYPFEKVE